VTRLHTTPPGLQPDTAPNPPLDIVLEKWKIPTFSYTAAISSVAPQPPVPPYIKGDAPFSYEVGQNDVKVINPDLQSDIFASAFTYFPDNLQHININFSSIVDEPSPQGGYYGNPSPESDFTTYSSLE
jgi:hypothetical protein